MAGCSRPKPSIRIDGSSTVYPVSAMIAELYNEAHPASRIIVGYSGTGGGLKKFIAGEIDVCNASRRITKSEIESCRNSGVEFLELEVAYDGLAVVVSKENKLCESMTIDQLTRLWTPIDPAKKWSDLDPAWPSDKVVLYGPGADSGTFDYFTAAIVGESRKCRSDFNPSEDDNVLVTAVSTNKNALGYFGYAYFKENQSKLNLLGIDAGSGPIRPTFSTISDRSYPLWRPLFIYVRKSSLQSPNVAQFIEFYLQNAALAATKTGYVPVSAVTQKTNLAKIAEK